MLAPEDFDPRFSPGESLTSLTMQAPDCRRLLEGTVADSVTKQLDQYLSPCYKIHGHRTRSSLVPRTFILKGPSGRCHPQAPCLYLNDRISRWLT